MQEKSDLVLNIQKKKAGELNSMVCAYFAHVADTLSKGTEDAVSVRACGDNLTGRMDT